MNYNIEGRRCLLTKRCRNRKEECSTTTSMNMNLTNNNSTTIMFLLLTLIMMTFINYNDKHHSIFQIMYYDVVVDAATDTGMIPTSFISYDIRCSSRHSHHQHCQYLLRDHSRLPIIQQQPKQLMRIRIQQQHNSKTLQYQPSRKHDVSCMTTTKTAVTIMNEEVQVEENDNDAVKTTLRFDHLSSDQTIKVKTSEATNMSQSNNEMVGTTTRTTTNDQFQIPTTIVPHHTHNRYPMIMSVVIQVLGFILSCSIVSLFIITLEDSICINSLSSRQHRIDILRIIASSTSTSSVSTAVDTSDNISTQVSSNQNKILNEKQQQQQQQQQQQPITTADAQKNLNIMQQQPFIDNNIPWGLSTIRGMGYGIEERSLLISLDDNTKGISSSSSSSSNDMKMKVSVDNDDDDNDFAYRRNENSISSSSTSSLLLSLPSYNEVMQYHRQITIPLWKVQQKQQDNIVVANAIHDMIQSYHVVQNMKSLANNYQWDTIRQQIHQKPITDISLSGSAIRNFYIHQKQNNNHHYNNDNIQQYINTIGFDWGSCAWRGHSCGTIADIQESFDEIDSLLGILEPNEILFVLDIIERSLRDTMSIIPWNIAYSNDSNFYYNNLLIYQLSTSNKPPRSISSSTTISTDDDNNDDDNEYSLQDQKYLDLLEELRID